MRLGKIPIQWPTIYLLLIVLFHTIFMTIAIKVIVGNDAALAPFWTVYVMLVGIPVAERISLMILFILARSKTPPRLDRLVSSPSVALLYCTCDDVVPECLAMVKNQVYENVNVFVLDDSRGDYFRQLVNLSGYTVIRRLDKKGYKAGNINNWLKHLGNHYDYFVILDADSVLPPDFVENMLLYAEHPDNQNIAFFESRIHAWCPINGLQRAMAVQLKMASEGAIRLSNRLGITLSNGHNNLCRTSHLLSVGGFDEGFISEDHATTLNLIAHGLSCQIVDVESCEIAPASLYAFKQRMGRWIRNDLQLTRHSWSNVHLALQFRILLHVILHFMWLPTMLTMLAVLWSYDSSLSDIINFGWFLIRYEGYRTPQLAPILATFLIYFLYIFITPIPQALAIRIRLVDYLYSALVTLCLGYGTMFVAIHSVLSALFRVRFTFEVTPKQNRSDNLLNFMKDNWLLYTFVGISLAGLIRNPASVVFNWTWILPLLVSPIVLYKSQTLSSVAPP